MSYRRRQICNRCGLDCEPAQIHEVRCNAPNCGAVERVEAPGTAGHDVPAGWVRVEAVTRGEDLRQGVRVTTLHYCPVHTPEAIAAATRGA